MLLVDLSLGCTLQLPKELYLLMLQKNADAWPFLSEMLTYVIALGCNLAIWVLKTLSSSSQRRTDELNIPLSKGVRITQDSGMACWLKMQISEPFLKPLNQSIWKCIFNKQLQ